MPFYDYKCTGCQHIFEIQKGMNEQIEAACPRCQAPAQRLFNVFRTIKSAAGFSPPAASASSSSCSSCSSGVCSSCSGR